MNAIATIALIVIAVVLTIGVQHIESFANGKFLVVKTISAPASFHTITSSNGKSTTFNRNLVTAYYLEPETKKFIILFVDGHNLTVDGVSEEEAKELTKGVAGENIK